MSSGDAALIVFGGTFDPPHAGHLESLELARKILPDAAVKIIPSFEPPLAGGSLKKPIASFSHRMEMCQLAFPGLDIDPLEQFLVTPSYSYRTLEKLAKSGQSLYFLLGSDQLGHFDRWCMPQKILDLANLVVVGRAGSDEARQLPSGLKGKLVWAGLVSCSASSHEIRHLLEKRKPLPRGWLPEDVAQYLDREHLYQVSCKS